MRFRAESHLRRPVDFARVRAQGRRFHCGGFVLWACPPPPSAPGELPAARPTRAGFVASRAAVGGAIERNRAKRRLREVFRHHQDRVPAGFDLILQARRSLNQLEYAEIERSFLKACAVLFPASTT